MTIRAHCDLTQLNSTQLNLTQLDATAGGKWSKSDFERCQQEGEVCNQIGPNLAPPSLADSAGAGGEFSKAVTASVFSSGAGGKEPGPGSYNYESTLSKTG